MLRTISIYALLLFACFPFDAASQVVRKPVFAFEFMSWGTKPDEIQSLLGVRWFPRNEKGSQGNMGSGREDVFPRRTHLMDDGINMMLVFEFADADSGLVAATMLCGDAPGLPSLPENFLDDLWDMNLERFGDTDEGKWIPVIGESKEWTLPGVFIKMIHLNVPTEGLIVKYVRQENEPEGT